jgi:hypothetical protein
LRAAPHTLHPVKPRTQLSLKHFPACDGPCETFTWLWLLRARGPNSLIVTAQPQTPICRVAIAIAADLLRAGGSDRGPRGSGFFPGTCRCSMCVPQCELSVQRWLQIWLGRRGKRVGRMQHSAPAALLTILGLRVRRLASAQAASTLVAQLAWRAC